MIVQTSAHAAFQYFADNCKERYGYGYGSVVLLPTVGSFNKPNVFLTWYEAKMAGYWTSAIRLHFITCDLL